MQKWLPLASISKLKSIQHFINIGPQPIKIKARGALDNSLIGSPSLWTISNGTDNLCIEVQIFTLC